MKRDGKKRENFHWRSKIAYKTAEKIVVRGYDLNELTGNIDFGEMAYLVWRGELPSSTHAKMLNAIMVCLAEHAISPSSAAARLVASGGVPLHAGVAGGMLAIGDHHGTFDRPAALFQEGIRNASKLGIMLAEQADMMVRNAKKDGRYLPGFHHPQHIRDPRSSRLIDISKELGVYGKHLELALEMEQATDKYYRNKLWLNAVGVSGALLSDIGFEPSLAKGVMLVARCVSLVAHVLEETDMEKGWRASSSSEIIQPLELELQAPEYYSGPEDRSFPNRDIVE